MKKKKELTNAEEVTNHHGGWGREGVAHPKVQCKGDGAGRRFDRSRRGSVRERLHFEEKMGGDEKRGFRKIDERN